MGEAEREVDGIGQRVVQLQGRVASRSSRPWTNSRSSAFKYRFQFKKRTLEFDRSESEANVFTMLFAFHKSLVSPKDPGSKQKSHPIYFQ